MRYLTRTGKGVVLGLALAVAMPAVAAVDVSALILAFLQGTLMNLLTSQFDFMRTGTRSIVQQDAAGAVAVAEAIKQNATVTASALGEATKARLLDLNQRSFGTMGTVRVDGRPVNIGSTAPSACHQVNDASFLRSARTSMASLAARIERAGQAWLMDSPGASQSRDRMVRDSQQMGTEVYDPSWVVRDTLSVSESERAEKSILYAFSPPPVPTALVAQSPAGREAAQELQRLQRQAQLPQRVMARQLALRTPMPGSNRSYLGTMQAWGQQSVEDPVQTAALGAKTEAGVLRELAITAKRQLAMEGERLQAQHETNALLALIAMRGIRDDMDHILKTQVPAAAATKP